MHVTLDGLGEEEEQVTGEVAMPLQGQLWIVLAGCVSSPQGDLMLLVSASCRASVPLHRGVQVTLRTWHWHSILASELLVSCRRLADPSPALGLCDTGGCQEGTFSL